MMLKRFRTKLFGYVIGLIAVSAWAEHPLHPMEDRAPLHLAMRPAGSDDLTVSGRMPPSGKPLKAVLLPRDGVWDCSDKLWLLLDIANDGEDAVFVRAEVSSKKSSAWGSNKGAVEVPPGATKRLPILIMRGELDGRAAALEKLFNRMRGYPGGHQQTSWRVINASALDRIELEFFTDASHVDCRVSNLRAAVDFRLPSDEELKRNYMPATDAYGQNRNADWPFKIKSDDDFHTCLNTERAWLEETGEVPDRNVYGGWTEGPRFKATGHFHTRLDKGVWWLVDPEGRPFWSIGATGFNLNLSKTFIPGLGKSNLRESNLRLKYGENWQSEYMEFTHERLRSWGMNTLGNWSSPDFYLSDKTPYVVAVHYQRPSLKETNKDAHSHLPDVFHPDFRELTLKAVSTFSQEADDPWCIGFFIDNELPFSQPTTPARNALLSDPSCASRQRFIEMLRNKYESIDALNRAWKSDFGSWDALEPVEGSWAEARGADMLEFSELWYREYYRICRDAMREAAPDKLYLGSRINHTKNKTVLNICSEFADVVSINFYDYTPDRFVPPEGFNAPVLIGEYHFGTITERGMWGGGLCTGMDINHAADLYRYYTRQAVRNPLIVGAHWFKFSDQPLTGRQDGENYRIGFVDVADTPYPEMVKACRETAEKMYPLRSSLHKE